MISGIVAFGGVALVGVVGLVVGWLATAPANKAAKDRARQMELRLARSSGKKRENELART